jgi:hypothetical protein
MPQTAFRVNISLSEASWDCFTLYMFEAKLRKLFEAEVHSNKFRIHPVPQTKHNTSITKINLTVLFKNTVPAYAENHVKQIDTKCNYWLLK